MISTREITDREDSTINTGQNHLNWFKRPGVINGGRYRVEVPGLKKEFPKVILGLKILGLTKSDPIPSLSSICRMLSASLNCLKKNFYQMPA